MTRPRDRDDLAWLPTLTAEGQITSDAETRAPKPNQVLSDRYELLGLLGTGGMGSVYRAYDRELDEVVALKMLRGGHIASPPALERFRQEAKLARRVTHANVARTFDIGEHGGEKFLTMEYVDGESLGALLDRSGCLAQSRVFDIAKSVCDGLAAAHEAGVVHRDLKPENVMLGRDGRVVITDFGVARAFSEGAAARTTLGLVGTPAYMAPEQVRNDDSIDGRADIYALGVMLFEMLSGELPWSGESVLTLAMERLQRPPPDLRTVDTNIPVELADITRRCMATDPCDRYSLVRELRDALTRAHAGDGPEPVVSGSRPTLSLNPLRGSEDKAVAVLPFRNQGPAEDDPVADSVTEEIIDTLSMMGGLRVRPRAVVMQLRGVDVNPRDSGRELGVQAIVEGALRRRGDTARLTARVMSVSEGFQLWAKRLEGPAQDLLALTDNAAQAIGEVLTVDSRVPTRAAVSNPVALDLFLRARSEFRNGWLEHIKRAVDLFREALGHAPQDASIMAGYARACGRLWFFSGGSDVEAAGLAWTLSQRAVDLAPNNHEAWLALGLARMGRGDLVGAVQAVESTLQIAPGLAEAHELVGVLELEAAKLDDAIQRLEAVSAMEPGLVRLRLELARGHALLGAWDRAFAIVSELDAMPGGPIPAALLRARFAVWGRTLKLDPAPDGDSAPSLVIRAVARALSNPERTPEIIQPLCELADRPGRPPRYRCLFNQLLVEMLSRAGLAQEATQRLHTTAGDGLIDINWLDLCPALDPIRKSPDFLTARSRVFANAEQVRTALGLTPAPIGTVG